MPIIQPAIRPPAEANSFLLQLTCGCSANSCTFCGAYLDKPFRIKTDSEIKDDISEAALHADRIRRVFLMDGDALVLANGRLLPLLDQLHTALPRLTRISSYANDFNIANRSGAELRALYERKLRLIYMGLESGSQTVLDACRKKSTVEGMVTAVNRATSAGIQSSIIVLLGIGGKRHSQEHVDGTIAALNRMQPRHLSFLSLMLIPGTPLHAEAASGKFTELNETELLQEARDILSGLSMKGTVFRSNHASNHLPLAGRLPADQKKLCNILDEGIRGRCLLRSDSMRGL